MKLLRSLLASGAVSLALMSPAFADHMLRIPYPEDPKTADTQKNTDDYTIPLNIYDRLVEAVTTGPGQSALVRFACARHLPAAASARAAHPHAT